MTAIYREGKEDTVEHAREQRFWARVEKRGPDECWLWTGALTRGYGSFGSGGRNVRVHRFAYEAVVGPIPEGLTIDHLCRVRNCVNPAHLEAVTMRENNLRSNNPPALNARKTCCPKGHAYKTVKEGVTKGQRYCQECINGRKRDQRAAILQVVQ